MAESTWCVVANVKPEAFGRATSAGTRHFAAGAKLWCLPVCWGDGYAKIRAIGRHRGSHQHVLMVVPSYWLTNWRARVAYHPEVVRQLRQHGEWRDQQLCEETARFMSAFHPPIEDLRERAARLNHALHLLVHEPRGRALETLAAEALTRRSVVERAADTLPPCEVLVLGDWLEEQGSSLDIDQLLVILDRRLSSRRE